MKINFKTAESRARWPATAVQVRSGFAEDDTTAGEVVGAKLHLHGIARKNPDEVAPHLAGDMRKDLVTVFELDEEHGVLERLFDDSANLNGLFFRHFHSCVCWGSLPERWPLMLDAMAEVNAAAHERSLRGVGV